MDPELLDSLGLQNTYLSDLYCLECDMFVKFILPHSLEHAKKEWSLPWT
jgi:hypothetical protein